MALKHQITCAESDHASGHNAPHSKLNILSAVQKRRRNGNVIFQCINEAFCLLLLEQISAMENMTIEAITTGTLPTAFKRDDN